VNHPYFNSNGRKNQTPFISNEEIMQFLVATRQIQDIKVEHSIT